MASFGRKQEEVQGSTFFKRLFVGLLVISLVGAALGSVALTLFIQQASKTLPTPEEMLRHRPNLATTLYDRKGQVIARLFQENRTWVPLQQISPWMIKATLAAEDDSFYQHGGVRLTSILRAFWVDVSHQGTRQGGSTITQQLARNLFLSQEKTFQRKIKEAVLALRLEKVFTKDQILELYLNTIYFGHGAYGIGAAAQTYFGKPASKLSLSEASMLAGLIAAPEYYTPLRNPEKGMERQHYVLTRMSELGWIDEGTAEEAMRTPLTYRKGQISTLSFKEAPYFVSYLLFKNLLPNYGADTVYRGGLRIDTTIDLDLQREAEKAIQKLPSEGAILALDPDTGEILAMVGGKDFETSKFNRAIQAFRQPGSAYKPIIYAAALCNGYRPVDHVLDAPITFSNGWAPQNYENKFNGEVTFIEALAHSYNTAAVRIAQVVGVGPIIDTSRRLGITTPYLPNDLSIALGSTSLTPLELGVAYCAFANNGYRVTPFGIRQISTPSGEVLEENGPVLANAIPPEVAVTMRSMLRQVVLWGTGRQAAVPGYDVFGKTGTTDDFSDAWFVGGVPGLVVVVYAGHDNHRPLGQNASGGVIAAPVWRAFVSKAVSILHLQPHFAIPPNINIEEVRVCRKTGFLATSSCPAAEIDIPAGTAPTASCPWHGGNGLLAKEDPNAPHLILSPNDEGGAWQYDMKPPQPAASGSSGGKPQQGTGASQPSVVGSSSKPALEGQTFVAVKKPAANSSLQPAPTPNANPYKRDPSPATDVEKKYQELLKKYGISNGQ